MGGGGGGGGGGMTPDAPKFSRREWTFFSLCGLPPIYQIHSSV